MTAATAAADLEHQEKQMRRKCAAPKVRALLLSAATAAAAAADCIDGDYVFADETYHLWIYHRSVHCCAARVGANRGAFQ